MIIWPKATYTIQFHFSGATILGLKLSWTDLNHTKNFTMSTNFHRFESIRVVLFCDRWDNSQVEKLKITVYQLATSHFVIEDTNYHNLIPTEEVWTRQHTKQWFNSSTHSEYRATVLHRHTSLLFILLGGLVEAEVSAALPILGSDRDGKYGLTSLSIWHMSITQACCKSIINSASLGICKRTKIYLKYFPIVIISQQEFTGDDQHP